MTSPTTNITRTDPEVLKKAKLALDRAKADLILNRDAAFFTSLVFSMRHVFDDSIETACTDGVSCRYNPSFFLALPPKQRLFVVTHEAMHPAYLHSLRRGDRNPELWNQAADHVINLQLEERGFEMPTWVLKEQRFKGMHVEAIYNILKSECRQQPQAVSPGSGGNTPWRDLEDAPSDANQQQEIEQQVKQILIRAQIRAREEGGKAPGMIPAEIQVYLDGVLNPKLPWHRILSKHLHAMLGRDDYSMGRPNKRFLPDYYLPSLYSESLDQLDAYVDISSSVSDHDFHQQISEIARIFRLMRPRKITLFLFNTAIVSQHEVKSFKELLSIEFKGRGGTRIHEVIESINKRKPTLALVLSDGGFNFPEGSASKVPTFWVVYNDPGFAAPFGKPVHYEI